MPTCKMFRAHTFTDPGIAVRMMMRLYNPPFTPGEIVLAWLYGARSLEWWMTKVGHHPDHNHKFVLLKEDKSIVDVRVQYGWSGNLVSVDNQSDIMERHKQIRALLSK